MAVRVLKLALEESTKKNHGVVRQHSAALRRATGMKATGQTISSMAMVRLLLDGVAEGSVMQSQQLRGLLRNMSVCRRCRLLLSERCCALPAGKCLLETGNKFDGQWREGRRHGTGSCLYANNDK